VLLGIFMGLLNMVPYLQLVGVIPAVLLSILHTLETPGAVIWQDLLGLLIVLAVVQLIQDGFLVPRIMGEVTGLRPAIILLSVFVWGKLLGFLGLVLAIPLTSLIVAYYYRYVLGRPVRVGPVPDDDG
jgi:predicted PurR-regulated permease PerM